MARKRIKPELVIGGGILVFGLLMLGSRKSSAATKSTKPKEGADGLPDPEEQPPKKPKRPIKDRPGTLPGPRPGGNGGGRPGGLPDVTPGGNGGSQPPREPIDDRPPFQPSQPGGISDAEKDVRDQAKAHNLGPSDVIGDPSINHDYLFLSDDCTRYLIGRDFLPSLPFGGEYYNPGEFWVAFASSQPPNFPNEYPKPPTHAHYLNEVIGFFFSDYDCIHSIPQREDFANEDDYQSAMAVWGDANPELADFLKELEILIYFDMMAAMKAADIERYYAWRELWHHPDDALFRSDNEWSSQYLAEVADRAYKKAYPNDPFPIPSANHPSAAKWNRILNYVNDYRNEFYGA